MMAIGCWYQQVDCLSLLVDLHPLILHCYQWGIDWWSLGFDCFELLGSVVMEAVAYIDMKHLTTD